MKKHLYIDPATLPPEGKTYSDELDPSIFLNLGEGTKATGPLFYDLFIQQFDNEILALGRISAPVEFTCVRSLVQFIQTIEVNDCSVCVEAGGGQIDLAVALREEIIIMFPAYPRCDEGDEKIECNLDSRYLAVDKPPTDELQTTPRDEAPDPWAALDAIENNDESSD